MEKANSEYLVGKLALEPAVGIRNMASLRGMPAALKIAGGNR